MNYNYRLIFLVLSLTVAAACGAFGAELTSHEKSLVEQPAYNVGKMMIEQKHLNSDVIKVVETMVTNTYAQVVYKNSPETRITNPAQLKEIQAIAADVLNRLGLSGTPVPITPPAPTPPAPVTPPSPKPSNSNQNPMVWVFVPVNMNVPHAPAVPVAIWPKSATVNQAPTIIIHRGFGANPPVIKYRYR